MLLKVTLWTSQGSAATFFIFSDVNFLQVDVLAKLLCPAR